MKYYNKNPDFIASHIVDFRKCWDEVNKVIVNAVDKYFKTFYEYEFGPGKDMTPAKQLQYTKQQYFCYLDFFKFVNNHIVSFNTIKNPFFGSSETLNITMLPENNVYIVGECANYVTIKLYEYINKKYMELINSKNPENKVHRFHHKGNEGLTGNVLLSTEKNEEDIQTLTIPYISRLTDNTWNVTHGDSGLLNNYPCINLDDGQYLAIYDNGIIASFLHDNIENIIFGKMIIEE